jgi:hypothetical protein
MTEKHENILEQDWEELPRSELFRRVILAVDGTRVEAEVRGDDGWMRYVENQLFPFLEKEMASAKFDEAAKEELEALLGVRTLPELSPEERRRGWQLVRTCDAYSLMRMALDGDTIFDGEDKENALAELRGLEESAETALRRFQREHGIGSA